ncbi:hypothetical protein YH64_009145 [Achromobacter sp. LC458]|nr:hypothetical protein YH64_009145 [Achromobacter sp. LC458]
MAEPCWCATCRPVSFGDMRMVLCPVCGNKRCPRAADHRYACTGSNEVGQVGVDVADMAHRAPQCLKYGANMSPEEIEAIAQRPTYCKADGEAVTLSRAERDALVAMARVAVDPRIREAIEATFEQRAGYMALIGAAVRALPELAMAKESP